MASAVPMSLPTPLPSNLMNLSIALNNDVTQSFKDDIAQGKAWLTAHQNFTSLNSDSCCLIMANTGLKHIYINYGFLSTSQNKFW